MSRRPPQQVQRMWDANRGCDSLTESFRFFWRWWYIRAYGIKDFKARKRSYNAKAN